MGRLLELQASSLDVLMVLIGHCSLNVVIVSAEAE